MGYNVQESQYLSLKKTSKLLNCGLLSGLAQAFVFNPWDRALYLSVKNERAFLHSENFRNPMAGVTQTVVQRAISAGLYFPLEDIFYSLLLIKYNGSENIRSIDVFFSGTLAGFFNGIIMNPFSRIKYQYWGKDAYEGSNFLSVAKDILKQGGMRHFFIGTLATINRDLLFGGAFSYLRHEFLPIAMSTRHDITNPRTTDFLVNLIAGTAATLLSSPFNYIRNIQYATPPNEIPMNSKQIMIELISNARKEEILANRIKYVQSRLRLGWGTARVGCGMAFGAKVYEVCSSKL